MGGAREARPVELPFWLSPSPGTFSALFSGLVDVLDAGGSSVVGVVSAGGSSLSRLMPQDTASTSSEARSSFCSDVAVASSVESEPLPLRSMEWDGALISLLPSMRWCGM